MDLSECTDHELRQMAQGCTEFTCLYHGAVNMERRRRDSERKDGED